MKKFKRAVTDSEAKVRYAEGKDGVNNLMAIYSAVTGLSYEQIEMDFDGKGSVERAIRENGQRYAAQERRQV